MDTSKYGPLRTRMLGGGFALYIAISSECPNALAQKQVSSNEPKTISAAYARMKKVGLHSRHY